MKLLRFDTYLDGGSQEFITDKGRFYYDFSGWGPGRGQLNYSHGYGKTTEQILEAEKELAQTILDFVPDGKTWMFENEENKQNLITFLKENKIVFKD